MINGDFCVNLNNLIERNNIDKLLNSVAQILYINDENYLPYYGSGFFFKINGNDIPFFCTANHVLIEAKEEDDVILILAQKNKNGENIKMILNLKKIIKLSEMIASLLKYYNMKYQKI